MMQELDDYAADLSRAVVVTYAMFLARLSRGALERLAMHLLQKREVDGLNGRTWDAAAHMFWEKRIAEALSSNAPLQTASGTRTSLQAVVGDSL
jgi:hypothetical protein